MKPLTKFFVKPALMLKQRGVVLFFALIALLAMSLAAVALIRSVDTNTMIAGNLAFKLAATTSGDAGVESAANWLQVNALANVGKDVFTDATHLFNTDSPALGYYSSAGPIANLLDGTIKWTDADSSPEITDESGNKIRVVIERMCPIAGVPGPDCLFVKMATSGKGEGILKADELCTGNLDCNPGAGKSIVYRITARSTSGRNSVSYVQAFEY
ncbi:MAG: hypothetical protein PHQ60_05235 [Sideroxydans sp.]|nr:hypothetical protein [Sideroxydans sp.]